MHGDAVVAQGNGCYPYRILKNHILKKRGKNICFPTEGKTLVLLMFNFMMLAAHQPYVTSSAVYKTRKILMSSAYGRNLEY